MRRLRHRDEAPSMTLQIFRKVVAAGVLRRSLGTGQRPGRGPCRSSLTSQSGIPACELHVVGGRREDSGGGWIFSDRKALSRRNPVNAMNVAKPSVTSRTLWSTVELMVEKSLLNATSVGKPSAEAHTFSNIRELTLERSRMNAVSVERLSAGVLTLVYTGGSTRERNRMNAVRAGKPLAEALTSVSISELTPKKDLTNVTSVGKPSVTGQP
ncbi:uncharacterized protein LOC123609514 [Leopardus geoffroyi]|uniref:uncharacterized protein LOC123609514 n=1 Tax=Leopardus geoffroyi TaxID=46844 RepID=UPI001E263D89|nr:uncharacterized protein LOC123609514 [Leopardus geoffroyi]